MIKYTTNLKIITLFLSTVFIYSCGKEIVNELPSGQLIGYVKLDKINSTDNDYSGVKVKLEGSSPAIEVTTDASGKYIIDDLKTGTYNFIYNKEGYGTFKRYGENFIGGDKPGVINKVTLSEFSNITLDSISLSDVYNFGELIILVNIYLSKAYSDLLAVRYYTSNSPDVTFSNYKETNYYFFYNSGTKQSLYISDIDTKKYPAGSKIYLIVYPVIDYYISYIDLNTGLNIYPAVNPDNASNVLSVTIPEM